MPPIKFAQLKQEQRTLRTAINQVTQPNRALPISLENIIQRNICNVQGLDILPGDIELYEDFLLAEIIYHRSQGKKPILPLLGIRWKII